MDLNGIPADLGQSLPLTSLGGPVLAMDCAELFGPDGPLESTGLIHVSFTMLTADFLASVQPAWVIVPLFATTHDATTAIAQLAAIGYGGRIAVLAPPLPKPRLVEQELRALGPGARLVLISP